MLLLLLLLAKKKKKKKTSSGRGQAPMPLICGTLADTLCSQPVGTEYGRDGCSNEIRVKADAARMYVTSNIYRRHNGFTMYIVRTSWADEDDCTEYANMKSHSHSMAGHNAIFVLTR
jgi:hypothetical protein